MSAPEDLRNKAQIILDSIRARFQEAGVELPGRQYLAIGPRGETAHDCAQLTVSYEMSYTGSPGAPVQGPAKCDAPTSASFIVELVRKVPVSRTGVQPVNPDAMSDYARSRMDDCELLAESAQNAIAATWMETGLFDLSAGSASGEYQAMVMTVIVAV
jgi:hypothetical protein